MPKLSVSLPKYRRHSNRDVAFMVLNGKRVYLPGRFGSTESKEAYRRKLVELQTAPSAIPAQDPNGIAVCELMAAYMRWAKNYYRDSQEFDSIRFAIRPLRELYANSPAAEFGPKSLKAVRQSMIDSDLCRNEVNKRIGRIKRLFKWGVAEELIPPAVLQALEAVPGLSYGRSDARESEPVRPVPDEHVAAVRPHVSPQIWAMIELQRYTGARPGEICQMRTADIDQSKPTWIYTPAKHKTQRHGHRRAIYLGPNAQEVLRPWLRPDTEEFLFQPREAVSWQRQRRAASRKTPHSCGNVPGSNRKRSPKRQAGEIYTTGRYGNAIRRACRKANIPEWHPHQLRHNAATFLRREYGLDVARAVLGHRSPQITEIYAELDGAQAMRVMSEVG